MPGSWTFRWKRNPPGLGDTQEYYYLDVTPADHVPHGDECVERCQSPNRPTFSPCSDCGHMACLPNGPCDICKLTVARRVDLLTLAERLRERSELPNMGQGPSEYVLNSAFRTLADGLDRLADE